jgi:ABC-type uncharacterized transport system permease subunit
MSTTVTTAPKRTSHWLHLVLTILTGGAWGLVWIAITVINKGRREKVTTRTYA